MKLSELDLNKEAQIKNLRTGKEFFLCGEGNPLAGVPARYAYRLVADERGNMRKTGSCLTIRDMRGNITTATGQVDDDFEIICNKF